MEKHGDVNPSMANTYGERIDFVPRDFLFRSQSFRQRFRYDEEDEQQVDDRHDCA